VRAIGPSGPITRKVAWGRWSPTWIIAGPFVAARRDNAREQRA
jgi:hypothetical protein